MAWPSRWPDGITFEELVTAGWLDDVSNSLTWLERLGVATPVTSNVVVDVTTAATSTLIIALPAITYEAVPHELRFHCPSVDRTESATGSPSTFLGLYDGAASSHLTDIAQIQAPATDALQGPLSLVFPFTPTAASHTYQLRGYNNTADSWTYVAGAGSAGALAPITCSVWRLPIGS